jgi:H+/gluconate symporter-like permease
MKLMNLDFVTMVALAMWNLLKGANLMNIDKWMFILGLIVKLVSVIIEGVKLISQVIDRKMRKDQEEKEDAPPSDQEETEKATPESGKD